MPENTSNTTVNTQTAFDANTNTLRAHAREGGVDETIDGAASGFFGGIAALMGAAFSLASSKFYDIKSLADKNISQAEFSKEMEEISKRMVKQVEHEQSIPALIMRNPKSVLLTGALGGGLLGYLMHRQKVKKWHGEIDKVEKAHHEEVHTLQSKADLAIESTKKEADATIEAATSRAEKAEQRVEALQQKLEAIPATAQAELEEKTSSTTDLSLPDKDETFSEEIGETSHLGSGAAAMDNAPDAEVEVPNTKVKGSEEGIDYTPNAHAHDEPVAAL